MQLPKLYRRCVEFNSSMQLTDNPEIVSVVKFTQDRLEITVDIAVTTDEVADCAELACGSNAVCEQEEEEEEEATNQQEVVEFHNLHELPTKAQV